MRIFIKVLLSTLIVLGLLGIALILVELRSSWWQAHFFSHRGRLLNYSLQEGPSPATVFPDKGPEDLRRGYAGLPAFTATLRNQGFVIERQARFSPELMRWTGHGFSPPYVEKQQTGLRILDRHGEVLYAALYPQRIYPSFDSIPPEIVNTLLYIENHHLLDSAKPWMNPAVEWSRFGKALSEETRRKLGLPANSMGGSTLATQIEKYRHSEEGRTSRGGEKIEQMISASMRAYLRGPRTLETRKDIVLQYVNTVPLAALPGYGEVHGLGDGLAAWYNTPLDTLNRYLRDSTDMARRGYEYRKALHLFIAHRRPSDYLLKHPAVLFSLGDSYARLLADEGVLSPRMRDAVLAARPPLVWGGGNRIPPDFAEHKAVNAVRNRLARLLGLQRLYDLDRLDLSASTTLDGAAQAGVIRTLKRLGDPRFLDSTGLKAFRLLDKGDPGKVIYSFTLYETAGRRNLLRVQADNYDQPLDINDQVKLELGSTAKLRTVVHYLEIFTELHRRWAGLPADSLRDTAARAEDPLSRWAAHYMADKAQTADTSLQSLLEAALQRKYSANPGEVFFTGGGRQTFANFEPQENSQTYTVAEAVRNSINLSFIRLMRDEVDFHIAQTASPRQIFGEDSAGRAGYLKKFAAQEGEVFLFRFFQQYRGIPSARVSATFFDGLSHAGPSRLAAAYHYLYPDSGAAAFGRFMLDSLADSLHSTASLENVFARTARHTDWTLADYGFTTGVHPLELWLVGYLRTHDSASWSEVRAAAAQPVQDAYGWLFRSDQRAVQDQRIRTMMETEAFVEIHRAWQRLGYPFATLVPSLGTAIGSSGDRPNALADLMGILLNDGRHYPSGMVESLHFAAKTPYETIFVPGGQDADSTVDTLLPPEICRAVRKVLVDVVENGTAARGRGAFTLPDGAAVPLGGKTGTGDQRYETFGRGGELIDSRVVNRTATFVFFLGDRFYGALTAYVQGPQAANYGFTSALPVSVLVLLRPYLEPLLAPIPDPKPEAKVSGP